MITTQTRGRAGSEAGRVDRSTPSARAAPGQHRAEAGPVVPRHDRVGESGSLAPHAHRRISHRRCAAAVIADSALANATPSRSAVSPSASALIRNDRSSAVTLPVIPWSASHCGSPQVAGSRSILDTAPQPMVRVSSRPREPGRYFSGLDTTCATITDRTADERHRLAGRDAVRLVTVLLVAAVVVGVHEDQPAGGQHHHGQVPADGVQVERGLAVHQVSEHLFVGQGDVEHVRDQRGVVTRLLDLPDQVGRLFQGHGDIVALRRGPPRTEPVCG